MITKRTWIAGLLIISALLGVFIASERIWSNYVGEFLACENSMLQADAILVENLDDDYLLFEKAAELIKEQKAKFAIVLVAGNARNLDKFEKVQKGFADVMINTSGLSDVELLPIEQNEPITLNAGIQVAKRIKIKNDIRSVLVIASGFRSKRTDLVYKLLLNRIGVTVSCLPVWGNRRPDNWTSSLHGIQDVLLQYIKLFYYQLIIRNSNYELTI
jgi:hypothetical protein